MAKAREIDAKGWLLILASTVGVAVSVIPVSILALGVFIKPLGADLGWGRAEISLALGVLSLSMAVAMPIAGRLIDRYGVRWPLIASLVLYGGGMGMLPALIDLGGLKAFYLMAAWLGVTGAASSSVAYVKILSAWFDRSRGLALGCAMSGVSLGGAITPLIATALIQAFGWRVGFHGLALLPICVGIPIALCLQEAPAALLARRGDRSEVAGMTVSQAMTTRMFWMLLALFLVAATAINGLQIHLAPLLSDRGLSPQMSALAVSCMFAISVIARFAAGYGVDRIYAPWIGVFCFFCAAVGVLMLLGMSSHLAYIAAVALLGIGAGAESDLLAILVSRYFGLRAFGAIYGCVFGAFMTGSALGPILFGVGYDLSGSYGSALVWSAIGLAGTILILFLLPRFPSRNADAVPQSAAKASATIV